MPENPPEAVWYHDLDLVSPRPEEPPRPPEEKPPETNLDPDACGVWDVTVWKK
jgi:hypothetical protein